MGAHRIAPRRLHAASPDRDDDSARHDFCPLSLGRGASINQVTIAAQDPISKIPEFKVCAVRVLRQYGPPAYHGKSEPQQ